VVLVFGLKNAFFPSVVELAHHWRRRAHPQGRNNVEESDPTCARWLGCDNGTEEGEN
jgi:hypothetical protein